MQRSGSIMAQGSSRTYLDRPEYLLDWCAYFTQKGDALRAEGLLNDAIQNLAEKQCFDLSTPAQQARYRAACRAWAAVREELRQAARTPFCVRPWTWSRMRAMRGETTTAVPGRTRAGIW